MIGMEMITLLLVVGMEPKRRRNSDSDRLPFRTEKSWLNEKPMKRLAKLN